MSRKVMATNALHLVLKNQALLITKVKWSMKPQNAFKWGQFNSQHNSSGIFLTSKTAHGNYKTMSDYLTNHQCLVLTV